MSALPAIECDVFYHVTLSRRMPRIIKRGIVPGLRSNWRRAGDRSRYGRGFIFAFEKERDAIRWAAKMGWEFFHDSASPNISIVSFIPAPGYWQVDDADLLSQAGAEGQWLKSRIPVSPERILGSRKLTLAMVRSIIHGKEEIEVG